MKKQKVGKKSYLPKRGDIAWINLNPVLGHEQAGRRPVLVVSNRYFNKATGLAIVVPVTSKKKGYAIEVPIESTEVTGVALVSGVRSIDWRARALSYADACPQDALRSIQGMLITFIASEE